MYVFHMRGHQKIWPWEYQTQDDGSGAYSCIYQHVIYTKTFGLNIGDSAPMPRETSLVLHKSAMQPVYAHMNIMNINYM